MQFNSPPAAPQSSEDSWMPDVMRSTETGADASDAFGVHSESSYSALFELMVDATECEEKKGEGRDGRALIGSGSPNKAPGTCASCSTSSLPLGLPHAGPHNLAGDPHARSRDGTWLDPVQATSTIITPSLGSRQSLEPIPLDSRVPPHTAPQHTSTATHGIPLHTVSPTTATTKYHASALTLSQRRGLLRRCKSRDLSTTRRELVTEFAAARKDRKSMEEQQMLAMPSGQNLTIVPSAVASDRVPRYTTTQSPSDSTRSDYPKSPFSLSAENLHTHYHTLPSRPHSMSSLQVTPVAEVPYFRRASEPSDHSLYGLEHSFSNEDIQQAAWNSQQLSSSVEHAMTNSPAMEDAAHRRWWDEKTKLELEEEWAYNESHVVPHAQQLSSMGHMGHPSPRNGSFVVSNNNAEAHYNGSYYIRQPPSPALEGDETAVHNKRSMSANSSVPSPPESPGFVFSAASSQLPTPEIGFPPTPTLGNGSFQGVYTPMSAAEHMVRHNSIPETPSSRRSSVSHCSAMQAATAALSATTAASKSAKSRPNSRPGSSRRKTSNSSMRSAAHCSPSMETEMSFVNFTPSDAGRILSGVAPSGSSKTKARREREAQEKRRKLTEAAAAAVVAAGGDASVVSRLC